MVKARLCGRCGSVVNGACECKAAPQSTSQNGYGRKWQKFVRTLYQKRVRQGMARCAACGLVFGSTTPHGDHIQPVKSAGDALFFDESNIQFLHAECHGKKTADDVRAGLTR